MALYVIIFMYMATEDDRGHQGQARYESSVGKSSECFPASADGGTEPPARQTSKMLTRRHNS